MTELNYPIEVLENQIKLIESPLPYLRKRAEEMPAYNSWSVEIVKIREKRSKLETAIKILKENR